MAGKLLAKGCSAAKLEWRVFRPVPRNPLPQAAIQ